MFVIDVDFVFRWNPSAPSSKNLSKRLARLSKACSNSMRNNAVRLFIGYFNESVAKRRAAQ